MARNYQFSCHALLVHRVPEHIYYGGGEAARIVDDACAKLLGWPGQIGPTPFSIRAGQANLRLLARLGVR